MRSNSKRIILVFDFLRFVQEILGMITLSKSAAIKIKSMQADLDDPSKLLRIFVDAGGCSGFEYGMSFDAVKPDDKKLEDQGISFVVDPTSLAYLDGSHVEFDDGLNGKGFEVKNPNATSTCGCGRSFN